MAGAGRQTPDEPLPDMARRDGVVIYVGIDPGMRGAIAEVGARGYETFYDIPAKGRDLRRQRPRLDVVSGILGRQMDSGARFAVEQQTGWRAGRASAFAIGEQYGAFKGILIAIGAVCTIVTPAKWKRDLGLGKSKHESLAMARELWPHLSDSLKYVTKHDGRAEALLIAEWLRRKHSGR